MGTIRIGIVRVVASVLAVAAVLLPRHAAGIDGFETRITDPSAVTPAQQFRQESAIDGNTVVYGGVATGSQVEQVFRYDIAARETSQPCPSESATQSRPDVSGGRAVFIQRAPMAMPTDIVLCDLATSAATVLSTDIDQFEVVISGPEVVIENCNGHCDLFLVDTTPPEPFSRRTIDVGPVEPHPRIDGDRLLFRSSLVGPFGGVVDYDIPSATARLLPLDPDLDAREVGDQRDVSGDLAVLTFFGNASGNREVVVYDLATDTILRRIGGVLGDATHPRIDGTRVVWEDTRSGSSQIWTMDLADGVEEAISPPGNDARFPAVSGNHVVYQDTRGGTSALYLFTFVSFADVLRDFDSAVANDTLTGDGPGESATGRLRALRNMLAAARKLIAEGDIAAACSRLADVAARMDGQPMPPDFATGPATATLAQSVSELESSIGCN